ncbi:hypothetical protein KP509_02G064000 [Ceratopteris richardii]|uniref:Uncharacterized protein n=1 Tax=Ceratopteris richardii TaxID=49495 RepID=A0A8T2VDQ3_CERRI|nr:hypothetical protein KP509_02G064000 [Ceratopteris richardii]
MIGASLDRDAVASSLRLAVPRDQNSCSDFNGLAPAPSMQEDEGLSLLNDVDVFYFHPSLTNDNLSSVSLSDAVSLPELDGSMQEFDGYFCSWELEGSGIDGCKDKEVFCDAIVDNASFLGDGIQQIGGQFSSPELNESASFQINESASAEMPTDGNCMGDNMQSSAISALRESDVGCSFREKGFVLFSTEKDQSHYVHFSNKRKRGDTNSNTGGREKSGSRNDALGKRQQRFDDLPVQMQGLSVSSGSSYCETENLHLNLGNARNAISRIWKKNVRSLRRSGISYNNRLVLHLQKMQC